tara:strand:- start:15547 stop:16155 length:609 start_codon:yes stop_codon:yes gene_type:complete
MAYGNAPLYKPGGPFAKKPKPTSDKAISVSGSRGFEDGGTGVLRVNPDSYNMSILDTSNIDFEDTDQVMNIQKAIGADADGVWGPQTERLYREHINKRRAAGGKDVYSYGAPAELEGNSELKNMEVLAPSETETSIGRDENDVPLGPLGGNAIEPGVNLIEQLDPADYVGGDYDPNATSVLQGKQDEEEPSWLNSIWQSLGW